MPVNNAFAGSFCVTSREENFESCRMVKKNVMDGYALLDHYAPIARRYDGYEDDEVLYFEVTERGSEIKRYIVVGSKDNWMECVILNEGY